ncbi:hypothetical protein M422DRAFT_162232, partial [Sphaerobolus stellatus SS14]
VETKGIDRIPESEREDTHSLGMFFVWMSALLCLTVLPFGMLGQQSFTLTADHTIATALGFTIVGSACVGFVAMLGPKLGMRTMVITRYSFGYWGGTVVAFLNVITQMGFSVIAVILAGQVLHNLNHNLPLAVGVVITGYVSPPLLFPLNVPLNVFLHYYERYAWLVILAVFIMILSLAGKEGYDLKAQKALEDPPGHLRAADILSFGVIMFSAPASYAPMAADYNCRLPPKTSKAKVFWLTFFGNLLGMMSIVIVGALLMTVPSYSDAYVQGGPAMVFSKVFEPWKAGGDFILVIIMLSAVGNNSVSNLYLISLSMQTLLPSFKSIPQPFWVVLSFALYTAIGVAGREHIVEILNNFLAILGYWVAFWFIIVFEEHMIFRREDGVLGGYDVEIYDTPSKLPVGIAAIVTSLAAVAGAVVGMAQVWYIGPVAAKFGPLGGDVGFELAAAIAAVVYPGLRYLEIRKLGR